MLLLLLLLLLLHIVACFFSSLFSFFILSRCPLVRTGRSSIDSNGRRFKNGYKIARHKNFVAAATMATTSIAVALLPLLPALLLRCLLLVFAAVVVVAVVVAAVVAIFAWQNFCALCTRSHTHTHMQLLRSRSLTQSKSHSATWATAHAPSNEQQPPCPSHCPYFTPASSYTFAYTASNKKGSAQ